MENPIYKNYKEGLLHILDGDYAPKDHLNNNIQSNKLIGRTFKIQEIAKHIADKNNENSRLIHVYGEDGNGKSDLVNYAARYALEGRVNSIHSAYHVKIENINTIDGLTGKIQDQIKKYNYGSNTEPIEKLYSENKYLIVIDKCRYFIQKDHSNFNEAIHEQKRITKNSIFIIISDNKEDIDPIRFPECKKVEVPQLDCYDAYRLLTACIPEDLMVEFNNQLNNER